MVGDGPGCGGILAERLGVEAVGVRDGVGKVLARVGGDDGAVRTALRLGRLPASRPAGARQQATAHDGARAGHAAGRGTSAAQTPCADRGSQRRDRPPEVVFEALLVDAGAEQLGQDTAGQADGHGEVGVRDSEVLHAFVEVT